VAGVLAQADIGHDQQLRNSLLDHANGLLYNTISGIGLRADVILMLWYAEEDDSGDAERGYLLYLGLQHVGREAVYAGHGGDFLFDLFTLHNEKGIDEIAHTHAVFRSPVSGWPRWCEACVNAPVETRP